LKYSAAIMTGPKALPSPAQEYCTKL
jgi:hypothetical protein